MKKITRREFLVDGSILIGGTVGTMALGGQLLNPKDVRASEVEFLETSCAPKEQHGKKVLVAYASFCGSTGGVAEAIGRELCAGGATVDIRLIKNVEDLSTYEAAVIGSATRASSWRAEAIEFVKNNQEVLSRIPVAYFVTCLALYKDTKETRKVAESYINPVLNAVPEIRPVDLGVFAGVLDYSKLNFMYRMVMKSKMKKHGVPEGDFRDWEEINAWSRKLYSPLLGVKMSPSGTV